MLSKFWRCPDPMVGCRAGRRRGARRPSPDRRRRPRAAARRPRRRVGRAACRSGARGRRRGRRAALAPRGTESPRRAAAPRPRAGRGAGRATAPRPRRAARDAAPARPAFRRPRPRARRAWTRPGRATRRARAPRRDASARRARSVPAGASFLFSAVRAPFRPMLAALEYMCVLLSRDIAKASSRGTSQSQDQRARFSTRRRHPEPLGRRRRRPARRVEKIGRARAARVRARVARQHLRAPARP